MAKNLENLKPFRPGQSGNPSGRNGVLPPEIRAERKKNQSALIKKIGELFLMTDKEAGEQIMKPETTQLHHAIQGVIAKAREGDVTAFKYLIELMVGKIPESDYDGFTEQDLRILNRVKEVFYEGNQTAEQLSAINPLGEGD